MQKQIATLLIIFFQFFQLQSQSIEISPENPNSNDCIYIYTKASTANLSFINESQITEDGNNITIETCFHESVFNAIGEYYDTIALGPLKGGIYNLDYLVSVASYGVLCEEVEQTSTQLSFEVKNNDSNEVECHELEVNVFPNPISPNEYLKVIATETIVRIDVFDSSGRFIYGKNRRGNEYLASGNYLFPVPGIYYLRINGNSPNSETIKVIKL